MKSENKSQVYCQRFWQCTCITRLITNYASIGKYRQRFFSSLSVTCLCSNSPIKIRLDILHNYKWDKKW